MHYSRIIPNYYNYSGIICPSLVGVVIELFARPVSSDLSSSSFQMHIKGPIVFFTKAC